MISITSRSTGKNSCCTAESSVFYRPSSIKLRGNAEFDVFVWEPTSHPPGFSYVTSQIPSHLAAAWIPLEDVHADAGPLYYFAGSHKIKKFKFGNGIFYNEHSKKNPDDFAIYLDKLCAKKLKKETLLMKKEMYLFGTPV